MNRFTFDPSNKDVAIFLAVTAVFGYILPIIPDIYKNHFLFAGMFLALGVITTPKIKDKATRYLLREKNIRYLSYHKIVDIDEHGNGDIVANIELLNEGTNPIQRHTHRFYTSLADVNKDLDTLARDGRFEIKSLDEHSISWEKVEESNKSKKINIVFDTKLNPGDKRKFSIRYKIDGLFKTKKSDLPNGKLESSSFTPIYICDKYKIKIKFRPNYNFTNLRYCIKTPSNEELPDKCREISDSHDLETMGRLTEVEEDNLWRNFQYRIEWFPDN